METMSVVEARRNFSEVMARVAYKGERVVVERRGRPMMALVSVEDLRRLEELEQDVAPARARRVTALEQAEAVRARIRAERNGVVLPSSTDILDQLKEERLHELLDLR